ncbi:MAG: nickel-dependent hydrogenase large subunit, partial [Pirellulaceae bacterium]
KVLRLVAGFDYPDLTQPYESISLRHAGEYAMNEGRVISSRGLDIAVEEFEQHFAEEQLPHSTALHCVRMPDRTAYLVGPLARWNLCREQVPSAVLALAEECGLDRPLSNNFYSIAVRALELLVAFDEAIRLVKQCRGALAPSRMDFVPRPGSGCHATEAPRGLLYHRYRIGDDGLIAEARIVPPTSQNQGQLEADLRSFLPRMLDQTDADITRQCEHLIRNYDPCISCATHFLRLEWLTTPRAAPT